MQTQTSNTPAGDHSTLVAELYEQNSAGLRRIAMKKGCSLDVAEDLVNSAFCNFMAHLETHPEESINSPFAYLATTVNNLFFDKVSHEKPDRMISLEEDAENPIDPSDNGSAVDETHREMDDREYFKKILQPHMNGFSEYESKLIWYYVIKDFKPKQIADILSEPYEMTSINCNRVVAKLRGRMRTKVRRLR